MIFLPRLRPHAEYEGLPAPRGRAGPLIRLALALSAEYTDRAHLVRCQYVSGPFHRDFCLSVFLRRRHTEAHWLSAVIGRGRDHFRNEAWSVRSADQIMLRYVGIASAWGRGRQGGSAFG